MGLWYDGNGTWPQDDARKAKKNAKSLEKCLKMLRPLRCPWSMSRHSALPLMTIEQHIPAIYSIIHLDLAWSRAGQSCSIFGTQLPTQKPNWKATGDMQNPSGFWDVWDPVWIHQINHLARGHSWSFWFHQPIGYLHQFDVFFLEVKWGEALWTGVFNIIILFKFLI